MNQLIVVASLAEKSSLRYSPGGVPIASGILRHGSRQQEAGVEREVMFEMHAIAAGEVSQRFLDIALDVPMRFTGFLARKNRNSKSLVFHVTEFGTP